MDGLPERRRYRSRCHPTTTAQPLRKPHKHLLLLAIYAPKPPLTAHRLSRPQATFDHGRLAHETPIEHQDAFRKCGEYECGPHCASVRALPPTPPVMSQANTAEVRRQSDIVLPPWQPDSEVSQCPVCKKPFTFLYRKHHCRYAQELHHC
jgi:hypothetical protein